MSRKRPSSLQNALRLLKLFSIEKSEYGVFEVAKALSIANSTAHRLLSTLALQDFVTKDHTTNLYRLSVSILSMQPVVTSNIKLYHLSTPVLQALTQKTKETSVISIINGHDIYCLNKADCQLPVFTYTTHIGHTHPLHYSAAGHVLLAYQDESKINAYIKEKLVSEHPSEKNALLLSLQQVKDEGYATTVDQPYSEITTVAAPIRNEFDKVIAAIEIIGPSQRIDHTHRRLNIVRHVKQAAQELSQMLCLPETSILYDGR